MDAKYCECQKVLLNLKWFVKHLCKVFEERLQRTITKYPNHPTINKNISSIIASENSTPTHNSQLSEIDTNSLKGSLTSINSKIKWTHRSLTNSPLLKRLSLTKASKVQFGGTPNRKVANFCSSDSRTTRLLLLSATTTENEREVHIKQFGENICVVYEYQIGMLESLNSVNLLATFVACILLKLLKNGVIDNLAAEVLNLSYLLKPEYYPKSFLHKTLKTISIGVSNNYISWQLKNIFTHPGLRYNHVGGENCSNLTIVTQLLCGKTLSGDFRRPDMFGYRNLICHKVDNHYRIEPTDQTTIDQAHTTDQLIKNSTETLMDHLHKCYKSIFFVVLDRTVIIEHLLTCQSFRTFCLRELITPVLFVDVENKDLVKNNDKRLFQNFNLFHISVTSKPLKNATLSSNSNSSSTTTTTTTTATTNCNNTNSNTNNDNDKDENEKCTNKDDNNNNNNNNNATEKTAESDDTSSFCSECRILSKVYDNHAFSC